MKIELPIDTSAVSFIDVMPPEPVLDHKTKQQRTDANRDPFAGAPPAGIRLGMPVKVTGLMVTDWSMGDRFGLTFRAAKIEAGVAQRAGAA